jgi:hypothetical protein
MRVRERFDQRKKNQKGKEAIQCTERHKDRDWQKDRGVITRQRMLKSTGLGTGSVTCPGQGLCKGNVFWSVSSKRRKWSVTSSFLECRRGRGDREDRQVSGMKGRSGGLLRRDTWAGVITGTGPLGVKSRTSSRIPWARGQGWRLEKITRDGEALLRTVSHPGA